MKVICDSCHAKYSLSDDKIVKGKTFKIKCKKCGNTILVKPEEGNPEEESTRVVNYNAMSGASGSGAAADADARIWHVAVGDKTDGPFTAAEVIDQIVSGKLGPDALAWNEGLPTWEKISTITDFAHHFSAQSAPAPEPAAKSVKRESRPAMEAVKSEPVREPAPEPAPAPSSKGGGFFGAEEEEPVPATSLKGQRHENSVLFSLDNLQNLASTQTKKPSPRPGYITPSSAGSGLVDIQEMAAAMKGGQPARPESAVPFDLPAAPVVATPISIAPVLIPTQMEAEKPKWIMPVVIGGVVAVVLIGIFVVWQMTSKKSAPAAAVNNKPAANTVAMANNMPADMPADAMGPGDMPVDAMEPDMPVDMPADAMEPDMPADMTADAMEPDMPADMTADMTSPGGMEGPKTPDMGANVAIPSGGSMTTSMDPPMTVDMPVDMPVNNDMPADGGCTKVWCMLKNNQPDCCAPFRGGSGGGDNGGGDACANNPNETLSPDDVKEAMSSVRGAVSGCFSKFGVQGKVTVRVSVGCNGSIQSVSATGEHAGSPVGGCIEKAVRTAKFPKFKKPASKSFQYPFVG